MRTVVGLASATLLLSCNGFAQYRGNIQPYLTGGPGSVVYPAGTAATNPGLTRITPNVVYPGGGGPRLVVPNPNANQVRTVPRRGTTGSFVYAYPVYVGSYANMYDGAAYDGSAPAQQQQNGVTVVMPPAQPPVIINQYYDAPPRPQMITVPQDTAAPPQADDNAPDPAHYLLAFKDHTIYSAIAYWVDGDTLHYFTAGNTHNQVSLSLIDRDMTERLNKDSGVTVKLPAVRQ
jgi:hypothetical protein